MQIYPEELQRSAQYATRRTVRTQVDVVMRAAEQCANQDGHALHDLRVGIRRLRAWLEAYEISLHDTVPKRIAKKLHRIQTSTNTTRDLEVQYQWLRRQMRQHPKFKSKRQARFTRTIRRQYRDGVMEVTAMIQRKLPRLARRLNRSLAYYCVSVEVEQPKELSMALAIMYALVSSVQVLHTRVARITSPNDLAHIHSARIAAKRLRYVLEPLSELYQAAHRAIDHLTALQDRMGELHDAATLHTKLKRSKRSACLRRARARLSVAREQYASIDLHVALDLIHTDISEVVTSLHAIAAEPSNNTPVSRMNERDHQLSDNKDDDDHCEKL